MSTTTRDSPYENDRYHIVVVEEEGRFSCLSRRMDGEHGPFSGEWRLLGEAEAEELAEVFNADPRPGGTAHVAEVFRFDRDPKWPEEHA